MNPIRNFYLAVAIAATFVISPVFAQDKGTVAPPPAKALSPKQQIVGFYALCKEGRAAEGLQEMLSSNPVVQPANVAQVANAFGQLVSQMGAFVDYELTRETQISKRTLVIRCVSHFERQPFVNEFTFYDPGSGDWRLVHLRYDANLASMFLEDLNAAKQAPAR